jgi:hypothetical protein
MAVYSHRSRRAYVRSSRCWGTTIALFRFPTTACLLPSHVEDAQEVTAASVLFGKLSKRLTGQSSEGAAQHVHCTRE